jgi:hypothetical protein
MQVFRRAQAPEVGEHRDSVALKIFLVTFLGLEMSLAVHAQDRDAVQLNAGQIFDTIWRSRLKKLRMV